MFSNVLLLFFNFIKFYSFKDKGIVSQDFVVVFMTLSFMVHRFLLLQCHVHFWFSVHFPKKFFNYQFKMVCSLPDSTMLPTAALLFGAFNSINYLILPTA
jgi:hypothetical protein